MRMRVLALATAIAGSVLATPYAWAQTAPSQPPTTANIPRQMTVEALEKQDLLTAAGTDVGDIEGVVERDADKKQFIIVQRGGFLGFGGKEIAVPLENLAVQNDRIVLCNMDAAQLDAMPKFTNENNAYRELDRSQQVSLAEQP